MSLSIIGVFHTFGLGIWAFLNAPDISAFFVLWEGGNLFSRKIFYGHLRITL